MNEYWKEERDKWAQDCREKIPVILEEEIIPAYEEEFIIMCLSEPYDLTETVVTYIRALIDDLYRIAGGENG